MNEEARALIERTIYEKRQAEDSVRKEMEAARRKMDRLDQERVNLQAEIKGMETALKALGGPIPRPTSEDDLPGGLKD